MRSSICSSDAIGVAGPPQCFRRSPWMAPCGLPRAVVVRGDEGVELAAQAP